MPDVAACNGNSGEHWKLNMILSRARRLGFRRRELEDAQQEVMLAIFNFRFDPAKANGASEAQALVPVIDNRLKMIQRRCIRDKKRHKKYELLSGHSAGRSSSMPDSSPSRGLAIDVRLVIESLSPSEKAVCQALQTGESRQDIADYLGISRYAVETLINSVRRRFEDVGLNDPS